MPRARAEAPRRAPFVPRLFGVRFGMLLYLYRRRVRAHIAAELLAGLGVALGVALVFGVLLSNASLTSAAGKLVHRLAGAARYELISPSGAGIPARTVARAGALPGVEVAAPILRANVTLRGPAGSEAVQLIGLSPSVEGLGGIGDQELAAGASLLEGGIGLPSGLAGRIGARRGSTILLASGGHLRRVRVRAQLGGSLTALAASPVALAVLSRAQALTGERARASEVLIRPAPGHAAAVRRELAPLAGAALQVRPATGELALLDQATAPNRQSTALFAAIAVIVGFLLALSAMLLTVPERRRFIAQLRMQGYDTGQIALLLGFQALMLGLAASAVGIGIGALLAGALFQRVPGFLTAAFPIGAEEAFGILPVALAAGCGLLAAGAASALALLELRGGGVGVGRLAGVRFAGHGGARVRGLFGRRLGEGGAQGGPAPQRARSEVVPAAVQARLAAAGALLIAAAVAIALAAAPLTVLSGVLLALAAVCLAPAALRLAAMLPRAGAGLRLPALIVAIGELRAVSVRSVALSATVALAVFGGVAIGGARHDLLTGIGQATRQYFASAPVWVTAGRDVFNTDAFAAAGPAAAAGRAPGVAAVRVYHGGLIDIGDRRMWLRARPAADGSILEASQLLHGDPATATRRLDAGGSAAISSRFAAEEGLHVGSAFAMPTPSGPRRLQVAAILSNSGWPPGTITIGAAEYDRLFGGGQAAALEVALKPGVGPARGAAAVRRALASSYPGLDVRTAAQRVALSEGSARQGLRTLQEISLVLTIAAALAVAAALAAAIWQRRRRLASLKVQGYSARQLWGAVLIESAVNIAAGCLLGAALGIGGHALASRYLELSTGFPAPFSAALLQALLTVAIFAATALAVIALPGRAAAAVSPRGALQE